MVSWRRLPALGVAVMVMAGACSPGSPAVSAAPVSAAPVSASPVSAAPVSAAPSVASVPNPAGVTKVAIAYDLGGRGSSGFNYLAWDGARRAAEALGAELKEVTARESDTDQDRIERLTLLADAGYNPIIGVGFTYAPALDKVAPKYPTTRFAIVDDDTVSQPNVTAILFHEEEGSFLVGVAAALTSTSHKVGFVGAVQIPLLEKFQAGFVAGVKAADPAATIQVAYLSQPPDYAGFSDPGRAREAALGMFDSGADVVFAAAGDSGVGVIRAAKERGRWAIGVDADQYVTSDPAIRDAVLTSMLKKADVGTYTFTVEVAAGTAKGGTQAFDLAHGGVGYATSGGFIDGIRGKIDAFAAKISSGAIAVPSAP